MKKEVSDLLWDVLDANSPEAFDEFIARYPDHAGEARKRRDSTSRLRRSRPRTSAPLRPRPKARRLPSPLLFTLPLLAIGGVLFAKGLTTRPLELTATVGVQSKYSATGEVANLPSVAARPRADNDDLAQFLKANGSISREGMPGGLRLRGARLTDALKLVGAQARLRVEVAPGFSDKRIDLDLPAGSPVKAIQALGVRYGFTPFDQGDGSILIVPVRDPAL